ncbi:MAG TPA: DnaJ domain-containing protein [Candidatus Limnocylindrales bacterium]|nr:DnaJ domain-containing protein [Candidatus Limnocylindrales bacterium]
MTSTGDPWRTLGLAPGASLEEVRRAYRRLAKVNHPDAAGEAALPRFLAIQAAYEQIAGPRRARRPGSRPGASTATRPDTPPREPWRADPDRARASGRADGRRPGARPTGRPAGGSGASASGDGATPGSPSGATGDRAKADAGTRSRRGPGGRSRKRATPYSTSYDAADEEPFEPGWTGAGWYGASSGTYWTINPKEYADPRKHGPEYQARARRSRTGWILDDEDGPIGEGATDETSEAAREQAAERPPTEPPTARPRATTWATGPADAGGDRMPPGAAGRGSATAGDGGFRGPLIPVPRTPAGRAVIALLGWPPLALFAASAIGESTGCGRYAASCAEASSPGTWLLGLALLILLFAAPAVARWSAHGTVAMLVIGVPCAVVLSAAGGTNVRDASAPLLLGVLAVAYLAGIAYGVLAPRLSASA